MMTRMIPLAVIAAAALACSAKKAPEPLSYEGSSTIGEKIMPEAAAGFEKKSGVKFEKIGDKGSGEGFAAVMGGSVPVAGMSRNLKADERAKNPYYRIIGYDAIAVFVHEANPVKNLTREQLKKVFTGQVTNWKELGWKDQPITVVTEIQAGSRATIAEFKRMVLDGAAYGPSKEIDLPHDCVKHVAGEPSAITFATLAFQLPGVHVTSVDGIAATAEQVRSGAYPLGRPLLLVARAAPEGAAKDFFEYMLSPEGQTFVAKHFTPVR